MKKLITHASIRFVLGFCFIAALFIFGNIPAVKAEVNQTVEGEWVCTSAPAPDIMKLLNQTLTISRKDDGYHVQWSGRAASSFVYSGNNTQIMYSEMLLLLSVLNNPPEKVRQQLGDDTKFRHSFSYTLTGDGNLLEMAEEGVEVSYDESGLTGAKPTKVLWTLKRISSPTQTSSSTSPSVAQVASRGDHAYPADCGPTVPNRTAPITTDLCPGNLVAMTYFCGGDTGCPYVCCPKGLPYLNHCDCKCYATADFDCHSYSKAQEQPKQ